ncbi:MAG: transposase [Proteobacteria bacterium]|nr:transposase [Pseudomonadota bacterium]MBU1742288.1 transposase [Pseudomonadota bacterium]
MRWDKTSCHRFEANEARLKMCVLAYNLLHMIRCFYIWGEGVNRSIGWPIRRIIKAASRISHHGRRWWVHVASGFPLSHHYWAVLGWPVK